MYMYLISTFCRVRDIVNVYREQFDDYRGHVIRAVTHPLYSAK